MTSFLARQKFLDGHFRFVCYFGDVYGNAHKFCQNKFNLHLKITIKYKSVDRYLAP